MTSISPFRHKLVAKLPAQTSHWVSFYLLLVLAFGAIGLVGRSVLPLVFACVFSSAALAYATIAIAKTREADSIAGRNTKSIGWLLPVTVGAVSCAIVVGLLEALPASTGTIDRVAAKASSTYLGALGFACVFTALELAFKPLPKFTLTEVQKTCTVVNVRLECQWLKSVLHLDIIDEQGESRVLSVDLSTTRPALQDDISLALRAIPGHTAVVVELGEHRFLRSIQA
jgi:hypothetical protein